MNCCEKPRIIIVGKLKETIKGESTTYLWRRCQNCYRPHKTIVMNPSVSIDAYKAEKKSDKQ